MHTIKTYSKIILVVMLLLVASQPAQAQAVVAVERVSIAASGVQSNNASFDPSVSSTGRYVSFSSAATNLVTGDTNGFSDIFLHNRQTGTTLSISAAPDGTSGSRSSTNASLSSDGQIVVFDSRAVNLVPNDTNGYKDVFLWEASVLSRVSTAADGTQADNGSGQGQISADGQSVVFFSEAENLIPGDTNLVQDIFVRSTLYPIFLPLIVK